MNTINMQLLDFIEFMNENIRDIEKSGYHKFYDHYHLNTKPTANIRANFKNDINVCFKRLGLLYNLSEKGEVERVIVNDVATSEIDRQVLNVKEKGTKELLQEAIYLHRSHDPKAARDSVEKLWDAFERLKTYYTGLDKNHSAQKIVDDIAAGKSEYVTFFTEEFNALTKIGNTYRIRHHETNKMEITDFRYYDYFFNRCLSLIAFAIQYLN